VTGATGKVPTTGKVVIGAGPCRQLLSYTRSPPFCIFYVNPFDYVIKDHVNYFSIFFNIYVLVLIQAIFVMIRSATNRANHFAWDYMSMILPYLTLVS